MPLDPLMDGHGRRIGDLRLSVTDRCNFRCQYCMPAEGLPWLERAGILTFEEIERLVALFVALGVTDVRLTGGEPLVRKEFPALAARLAAIDGLEDLSVTTNGYLLERDAAALVAAGVLTYPRDGISLLGDGEIEAAIKITVTRASKSAVAAVEKAGGSVTLLPQKPKPEGKLKPKSKRAA